MKTVIQVYKICYNNVVTDDTQNFHGIGDFFRSTLGLYNLSKIYNFKLIVDFSLHPIQNFLEYKNNIMFYIKELLLSLYPLVLDYYL